MKKIVVVLAIFSVIGASAQVTGDLLRFSQNNFGMSTARSAAMGGAYTSLGADAASMSINPAGLAMYRSSDVTLTPYLRLGNTQNGYSTDPSFRMNDRTSKIAMSNISAVLTDGTGFSYGFGYNRLADFYSFYTSAGAEQSTSITDMFASQLNNSNIQIGDLGSGKFFNHPPVMWGSILGYDTYAVDWNGSAYQAALPDGALVDPTLQRKTDGSIDEYAFSAAYVTPDDKFYIGATLGVQSLRYSKRDVYTEYTKENLGGSFMSDLYHERILDTWGTGYNLKLGMIYRPFEWFRLGVSYHSPTWMSLEEENSEYLDAEFFGNVSGENKNYFWSETPIYTSSYKSHTPSRLLGGMSVTVANRAIISFDYKRTWMNSMKFSKSSINEFDHRNEITATEVDNYNRINDVMDSRGNINLNRIIADSYRPINNYSLGAEIHLGAGVFVRGGYMYQDSPYSNTKLQDYGKMSQVSGGVGFRSSNVSVDLAYVNSKMKNLPYGYYYYEGIMPDGDVTTEDKVDMVMLSVGFRF